MWNDVDSLQRLAKTIPYVFIVIGFLIAISGQFVKSKIDDRVKFLQKQTESQRQANILRQLDISRNEVAELENRILSATATIEATLNWDALGNSNDWKAVLKGNMSYVAFGKDSEALLVIRSQSVVGESVIKPIVTFWGHYDLGSPESQINCNLTQLLSASFIQIGIPELFPNETLLTDGKLHLTINGNKKTPLTITNQRISNHTITISDLQNIHDV